MKKLFRSLAAMKHLLLAAGLLGAVTTQAQTWKNPLPLDSLSGYIVYRGRFDAPGQSQAQTLARAARFARTELTGNPAALVDTSQAGKPVVSGAGQRGFAWRGNSTGRTLHYELLLRPRAGYYEYELSDLTNETPTIQYSAAPGVAAAIAPRRAAVEAVIRNPTSYDKKHRPTAALRDYCEAVSKTVQAELDDTRAALGAR